MNETVTWINAKEKMPPANTSILLALTDGHIVEGFWDKDIKIWVFGQIAIGDDDALDVHHWAEMPRGPALLERAKT